ncbi:MAG: hydroxyisourate hydrolase [SAR324 cluster bacterium]|nr:hydroxyisourate hydrolase [SAR324 cluster bacterium]MBL7034395.1 hydroxyisourate hydrolase [SAR324 cluster bacterium]
MSHITTHVLDTSQGCPGANIRIRLELQKPDETWHELASGTTNNDGRVADLISEKEVLASGVYRMIFETGAYFEQQGTAYFYPEIEVRFLFNQPEQHYHIPLLLSAFGYSTYRGS